MQRSGAATRRFYAAFYHWTLRSANPTRRCAGTTATLVTRRKQSTAHGASARSQRHSEPLGTSEQLRKEAVQSTADRPTESLELWEHAVRNKSEKSVTVELLVPRRALRSNAVAKKAQLHEVTLSTPGLREDAGDDEPCAVVLEGDYTDVKAVWKNLYSHGAGQSSNGLTVTKQRAHADVEPIAHRLRQDFAREQQHSFVEKECSLPESFWQPIGKEGTAEYLQTQFGLHVEMLDESGPLQYARLKGSERQVREVDTFLEDIRTWELEKAHDKSKMDVAAKQVKIVRRNDLPSENLEVWQSVTRKQLQGETEIDICLPERVWQRIRRNGGPENLHARFAMEFEPLQVSGDGKTRCLTFRGDVTYADRARSYLEGFRVNIPELQEDEEYLKIYSAATGLHMTKDVGQRQSARRSQDKIDSNKHTAQATSVMSHKSSANVSPGKQTIRDDAVSDKSRETKPAVEGKVDRTASWNTHKRVRLTPPKQQSAHGRHSIIDNGRFAVPEHMRQEFEASNESTLAQIQQDSGLTAIWHLETVESKQFLKFIGSPDERSRAIALLQKSIDDDNERTGRSNPGIEELAISIDSVNSSPKPTYIAWIHIPHGFSFGGTRRRGLQGKTETQMESFDNASGRQLLKITGPKACVEMAVADIRIFMEEKSTSTPAAKLEVLKMGLIEDVGEGSPVELSEKAAEAGQQTPPEMTIKAAETGQQTSAKSTVKASATEEQPPTSSDKELDTPKEGQSSMQYVWLRIAKTIARSKEIINKKLTIGRENNCFVGKFSRVTSQEGFMQLSGSKEALTKTVRELQQLIDERRKNEGKPPLKIEVLHASTAADARHSILSSVMELDTPKEGLARTHFAWLKVPKTYSNSEYDVRTVTIGHKHNCLISGHRVVTKEEGAVRVIGSEEALRNAIGDLQRVSDEGCKETGKPPVKLEIVSTGLYDNMPQFAAVKELILTGAPAIGKDQASESVERPAVQSVVTEAPAIGKDRASESIEQPAVPRSEAPYVERDHFAWIKIIHDESTRRRVNRMKADIASKVGCKLSDPMLVGTGANEIQRVVRVVGSEDMIKLLVNAMQQQMADEIRDTSGKPVGTVEIIQMGLKKDMVDFKTFSQSFMDGPSAVPVKQSASSPRQTSIENGAAEQAVKLPSTSTSGKTAQHTTVDRADAPDVREAEEKQTKQSNQQLGDDMRSALRHITQPVALVTSYAPQAHLQTRLEKRTQARGVTVSSFCTVTLQPVPVVSFNLRVPSRSWDAISGSGYLRVHLLKASPEGAAVAHAFTLPYEQPHQPFEHLSQSGVRIGYSQRSRNPASVPQIRSRAAIHASFVAKVMPEKCIQVGDHIIVVAEVKEIEGSASAAASLGGALAYGMRGYRQLGDEIQPMELKPAEQTTSETQPAKEVKSIEDAPDKAAKITEQESVPDHVKPGEKAPKKLESAVGVANEIAKPAEQESAMDDVHPDENAPDDVATNDMADLYARFAADPDEEDFQTMPAPAPKNIEDLTPSSPMLDEESLRQVLEENEAAYSSLGLPSQTAAENPALAEALSAVAGAYSDASEPAVSSQPESTTETRAFSVDQAADPAATSQPEPIPQTEAPSDVNPAKRATREERPSNALSTGKRPWGLDETMTQQIRKLSIYHTSPPRRHYSTTNNNDTDNSSPKEPSNPPLSKQLLKTTVADYLCQIPTHRKRYTNLIKQHRTAQTLESQLSQPSSSLTPEEAATLTTQAQTTRRAVTRELALRNAQDLRAMLDKGRVAAGAAQWLESCLEQGQVVLLEEAKVLRRELEDGRMRVGDFERAKAELTKDYEGIDAQLMRLREFAEDDGEGEFGEGDDDGVVEENHDGKEGGRG
jgi:flavin reductase (DIM6/NTAB) family NADH-FMN oxidoreductase RutF